MHLHSSLHHIVCQILLKSYLSVVNESTYNGMCCLSAKNHSHQCWSQHRLCVPELFLWATFDYTHQHTGLTDKRRLGIRAVSWWYYEQNICPPKHPPRPPPLNRTVWCLRSVRHHILLYYCRWPDMWVGGWVGGCVARIRVCVSHFLGESLARPHVVLIKPAAHVMQGIWGEDHIVYINIYI